MNTKQFQMLNDAIGKMSNDVYSSSTIPETKEEKERREKKRIKGLKSSKSKEKIKKLLLSVERKKEYDKEIDRDIEAFFISATRKELSEEQVKKIAAERVEIRENIRSEAERAILDNMIVIKPKGSTTIEEILLLPARYS